MQDAKDRNVLLPWLIEVFGSKKKRYGRRDTRGWIDWLVEAGVGYQKSGVTGANPG